MQDARRMPLVTEIWDKSGPGAPVEIVEPSTILTINSAPIVVIPSQVAPPALFPALLMPPRKQLLVCGALREH